MRSLKPSALPQLVQLTSALDRAHAEARSVHNGIALVKVVGRQPEQL